jgi:hypothetical protein
MMSTYKGKIKAEDPGFRICLLQDFIHRLIVHHSLWYGRCREEIGEQEAFEALSDVVHKSYGIFMKRLGKILGFDLKDDHPALLHNMPPGEMQSLQKGIAVNWLANDGVWFQEIENRRGMKAAKAMNDDCWAVFSPFEARSIKRLLEMQEEPGLEGLKTALNFRLYAFINQQSIEEEKSDSFVFRMRDCRVQSARKRRNLPDYPCKSAGIVEYSTFAQTIDHRIQTTCLACPPDNHPDDWYCSWKFILTG